MEAFQEIKTLLAKANRVFERADEIAKLRGESFNVFSILKMESKENSTHSAFLGELLNPNGTHHKGALFLKMFIRDLVKNVDLDVGTATVELEKPIGVRNDLNKVWGRVDILISDRAGRSICIENKIYASDQVMQIERYRSYNRERNTVIYLTLKGDVPQEISKGKLKENEDFICLSYRSDIIKWLEKCWKESADRPILRETIRQYIILINKLTNQMNDDQVDNDLQCLILEYYKAASTIKDNIYKVEKNESTRFLHDVHNRLLSVLNSDWTVTLDPDLSESWSGLRISHKSWNGIYVMLQGNPKIPWGKNYFGVVAHRDLYDREQIRQELASTTFFKANPSESAHWPGWRYIFPLDTLEDRKLLFDENKRSDLQNEVFTALLDLALECEVPLSKIKRIKD